MSQLLPVVPSFSAPFDDLAALTLMSVQSPNSQRVYAQTYRAWSAWCIEGGHSPLELTPRHVIDFLNSQDTTKATRQRQLSALRKLVQMLVIAQADDATRRLHEALKLVKAPVPTGSTRERTRKALSPAEADRMLRQWEGENDQDKRNTALVAVLLLTGIRRSEAAALRWVDVDFDNGVLHIRHGKGDKARDVPLAGDFALEALREWRMAQPHGYEWVFTPVAKGGRCADDRPLSGTDVYRVWVATAERAGMESKPHDARRTLITEALATGTPVQTVQAIAGHARGDTTLEYAQSVDARRARKELKLRYG